MTPRHIGARMVVRCARACSLATLAWLLAVLAWPKQASAATSADPTDAAPLWSAFPVSPFPPPLAVNGGFCEFRQGHFHGGFDLGTDRRTGRAVLVPASGSIMRVRTSGVGYGRSVYLLAEDGRLLVFAHLDAFAPELAEYVRARQDSSGVYEQDLWPEAGRFRFAAGDTLAWSGESGAGGPHLHIEIRRQDMAYHPQRAGLSVPDSSPPTLASLTLEPLDEMSRVAGRHGPSTFQLERPETVQVVGRLRAIVGARDGVWAGVDRMVPWEVGMEWDGRRTLARFDSVSWATDMEESDFVYDTGRVLDSKGILLWAPAGFRPRVLLSDAPAREPAGVIVVSPGDKPRKLKLWARDLGGNLVERRVVLLPTPKPKPQRASGVANKAEAWSDPPLRFASLPGGVRMTLSDSVARRAVDMQWGRQSRVAVREDSDWESVLPTPTRVRPKGAPIVVGCREHDAEGRVRELRLEAVAGRATPAAAFELRDSVASVQFPAGTLFEEATLLAFPASVQSSDELVPLGSGWRIEPARLPLRRAAHVELALAPGESTRHAGLFRRDADGWQWLDAAADSGAKTTRSSSRQLGAFAVFRDTLAPRVPRWAVAPDAGRGPYNRWAFEADLVERGSGVDARASGFEVDGKRVPTEWDPEASRIRWRPATPPRPGTYRVVVIAADRAGNQTRLETSFTIPS